MKIIQYISCIALLLFITSCEKKAEHEAAYDKEMMSADTVATMITSQAASTQADSNRSFVRTADLKFKVQDARNSSISIENIIISNGGFITYSHLRSENIRNKKVRMYNDSVLQVTQYYLVNDLEFRVPVNKLLETLLAIGKFASFIDYRTIEAKDKTWDVLRNNKSKERLSKHTERLSGRIKNQKDKILETGEALDNLLYKEEELDNAEVNQLIWNDEITYSTVKVHFYEKDQLLKELIVDENYYTDYSPGLIKEASYNFKEGYRMAEAIVLFFIRIWPFMIVFIAIAIIYYRFKFKEKNNL